MKLILPDDWRLRLDLLVGETLVADLCELGAVAYLFPDVDELE